MQYCTHIPYHCEGVPSLRSDSVSDFTGIRILLSLSCELEVPLVNECVMVVEPYHS